jgi:hypothetical protein
MKSVFDPEVQSELISRIQLVTQQSTRQWGKMNVFQMLCHCTLWEEMVLTNRKYKRVFIGLILGKMLLRNELKDSRPMRKNNPTIPDLIIIDKSGDIELEKQKWIAQINRYASYSFADRSFVHPFFGRMTKEQVGQHAYKHSDHHLRQFSC